MLLFTYKRIIFGVVGIVLLFLFYLFSVGVKQNRFATANFDITVKIQDKAPKKLEPFWEDMGFIVSPALSVVLVMGITGLACVDWKKKKIVPLALLIPLLFGCMVMAEIVGKNRVESPAPPYMFLKNPTTHFPKFHVQEGYSYPSGHAARSLFLSSVLLLVAAKKINLHESLRYRLFFSKRFLFFVGLALFVFSLSFGIAIGKVYLGHHWASDIVGGWIIASAFVSLLASFTRTS